MSTRFDASEPKEATRLSATSGARLARAIDTLNFREFDRVIVAYSGGKDSLACILKLLDLGVPRDQLELWHHDVDGGHEAERFMDWPCTAGYARATADALGLPLYFSWKDGGFRGEMYRNDVPTTATSFERPRAGLTILDTAGGAGPKGTRMRYPALSADLSARWCSAYLKIDVGAKCFSNDPRFKHGRFLFVTGERRQESTSRSKYAEAEHHRSHGAKREVIQWRPVIDFSEAEIWALIQKHGIQPHPAYCLGFGRVSCAFCIFGNPNQFASAWALCPEMFDELVRVELEMDAFQKAKGVLSKGQLVGGTLRKGITMRQHAERGALYEPVRLGLAGDPRYASQVAAIRSKVYTLPVRPEVWTMPAGAFGESDGPT